ncbi:uncharacterized protein BO95DRAFT_121140 [Aspergillus brunneoviolaceus CBS 621.78]|uniref:Uncharacterized protein n=1 Tax=Aspergillus brunneoviolaceus CBS 621.78 TaxID=1450534 RepID=A0ACD1GA73_9EURO|nr:hypothetical protein BO95DRAFT_121140 [Aspergillus brunneoviolaceus CBS 621.78]RAH46006.1 hypothetical protein BO95DRAFT_121140 [Aspergillus brunneoviolaceus CBS 621.78]
MPRQRSQSTPKFVYPLPREDDLDTTKTTTTTTTTTQLIKSGNHAHNYDVPSPAKNPRPNCMLSKVWSHSEVLTSPPPGFPVLRTYFVLELVNNSRGLHFCVRVGFVCEYESLFVCPPHSVFCMWASVLLGLYYSGGAVVMLTIRERNDSTMEEGEKVLLVCSCFHSTRSGESSYLKGLYRR